MHFIMTKWQNKNEIFFSGGVTIFEGRKRRLSKVFSFLCFGQLLFRTKTFFPSSIKVCFKLSNMVRNSLSKSIYKSSKEFSIWQFDHTTIFKIRRLEVDPVVLARDLDEVQTSSWKFWKTFFESVCATLMARLNY